MNENSSSEVEIKFIDKANLVHSINDIKECTPDVNESNFTSLDKTPSTLSSYIHRINQITYSGERQDYVLNLFDKMNDVDMDPEDYYDIMTDVDAHGDSLVESPESQAYL